MSRSSIVEPGGVERLRLRALDLEAVELGEQLLLVGGDEVDRAAVERLLGGEVLGLGDHPLGELAVAAVALGERADEGGGVVFDLHPERAADVARRSTWTALAEPMLVCGAIAATSAASVMKAPAEAARAPSGET